MLFSCFHFLVLVFLVFVVCFLYAFMVFLCLPIGKKTFVFLPVEFSTETA